MVEPKQCFSIGGRVIRIRLILCIVLIQTIVAQASNPMGHADMISALDQAAFERGQKIYASLCVVCHGTQDKEGSLPTALRFGERTFKNGSAPFQMYNTITRGYGQMVAQSWMKPQQVYDVIHYIREDYLSKGNPSQYVPVDDKYLASLPQGINLAAEESVPGHMIDHHDNGVYKRMDYGPYLMWTYEVAAGNIAYKAIAQRLDGSAGGVVKGQMFMVFDHDTMRVAAGWSGSFVNWKGIMFDGSHGTHT
ncbi:MAG: cytochrome c [Verrucomicrobia bacterium]|nr:cytochrome c [Verrucomicrobiota bacterium]